MTIKPETSRKNQLSVYVQRIASLSDFPLEWMALFVIFILDVLWANQLNFSISGFMPPLDMVFALGVCVLCRKYSRHYNSQDSSQRIILGVEAIALTASSGFIFCVFSYLIATTAFSTIDRQLIQADAALGFDWEAWSLAIQKSWLQWPLWVAYRSLHWQLAGMTILFAVLNKKKRLKEAFWIIYISFFLTFSLFFFLPALGPAETMATTNTYIANNLLVLKALRLGKDPDFLHSALTGIISFPSFHTSLAVIYGYLFRKMGLISYAIISLNVLMVLSIPSEGGHYFIDVLAGITVGGISIFFGQKVAVKCWQISDSGSVSD